MARLVIWDVTPQDNRSTLKSKSAGKGEPAADAVAASAVGVRLQPAKGVYPVDGSPAAADAGASVPALRPVVQLHPAAPTPQSMHMLAEITSQLKGLVRQEVAEAVAQSGDRGVGSWHSGWSHDQKWDGADGGFGKSNNGKDGYNEGGTDKGSYKDGGCGADGGYGAADDAAGC